MKTLILLCLVAILSACNNSNKPEIPLPTQAPTTVNSSQNTTELHPVPVAPVVPAPPPPSHNYVMEHNGTYGYEPALSEDDVRNGKAVEPLLMMRYVGFRNATYVLLLLNQDNVNLVTRVTCQAPCNFAQMQVMSGTEVLKTETIRVVPSTLIGAMLVDAMSGQLKPYGQVESMPQITAPPTVPPMNAVPAPPTQSMQQNTETGTTLQQPSFNCSKARSIPEYLICHDPELAASDRDLASVYKQAKDAVIDKTAFAERTRRQWNYREKNCRDKECLVAWYAYQKNVLTKITQTGDVNTQEQ